MRKVLRQRKISPDEQVGAAVTAQGKTKDGESASVPRRLPPLQPTDREGSDQGFSALQQATVTSAHFELNSEGKGVATFEFSSLVPLGRSSSDHAGDAVPQTAPGQRTAGSTSYPMAKYRSSDEKQALAPVQTRTQQAASLATSCYQGLKTFAKTAGVIVCVVLFGNVVFSSLEAEHETNSRAEYTEHMISLRDRYNMSDEDFDDILDLIGTPLEFDPDGEDRNWGASNSNSVLFVFTIVSTIGYGNFSPQTDGGKIFLMVYAALGIPIVGTCVGKLATQFLGFVEWWAVIHMDAVQTAFKFYDTDRNGLLDEDELFLGLQDLKIHLSREEVHELMTSMATGDMLTLEEFKVLAAKLDLPLGKAARARLRLLISCLTALAWLFVGSLAYVHTEGYVPFS